MAKKNYKKSCRFATLLKKGSKNRFFNSQLLNRWGSRPDGTCSPVHLLLTQSKMQPLLYILPCASHTGSMFFGQGQVLDASQPTNPSSFSSEVATDPTAKRAMTADVTAIIIVILDIMWIRCWCFAQVFRSITPIKFNWEQGKRRRSMYRVTHQIGNWIGLTLIWMFNPSCPATQPFLPNSHPPKQNLADSGIANIKVNPTQLPTWWVTL